MRKHFVTFLSPGTMFDETTTKPIDAWNPVEAARMAQSVTERHGAKPYGLQFSTCLVADPVSDGEGGTLAVEPKEVERSGIYYLGGTLRTVDEVRAKADPQERILLNNMEINDYPLVVESTNSFKVVRPFAEEDRIVDADGITREKGDDPRHVEYRRRKIEEHRLAMERARGE